MQGPAINASGRRLPKRTAPAATIGLGGTAVGAVIDTSPEPADHERMQVRGQHADAAPGTLATATAAAVFIQKVAVANETCVGHGTSAESSRCERSNFKDQPK
jgi:hypothetical protein